jgi:hypothetical protein
MSSLLEWLPTRDGWLGTLPCGFVIFITLVDDTPRPKLAASPLRVSRLLDEAAPLAPHSFRYAIRFGNCSMPQTFSNERDAKTAGIVLARRVLMGCLRALQDHGIGI